MKKRLIVAVTGVVAALLLAIPALATSRDVNDDNLPDRWEKRHSLSLSVNQAPRDQDHDGLRNKGEYREGTDPRDPDSDADGAGDKEECDGEHGEAGSGPHGPKPPPPVEPTP